MKRFVPLFLVFPLALTGLIYLETSSVKTTKIPLYPRGNAYYADVWAGGLGYFKMMVDTGAAFSLLPMPFLEYVEGARFVREGVGRAANGGEFKVQYWAVPELRVGECVFRNVEIAFAGDAMPLLGENVLKKAVPYTVEKNSLELTCQE